MIYTLPLGDETVQFELPDSISASVIRPAKNPLPHDAETEIEQRLDAPIGAPPLSISLTSAKTVLIITDDDTRPTPIHRLLPPVIKRLQAAGIKDSRVKILIAYGLHRKMDREALTAKLGTLTLNRFEILHHDAYDATALYRAGTTFHRTTVYLHNALRESDFIIGLGNISPSKEAGFGGGAKIVMPGVAGAETIHASHAFVQDHPNMVGRISGNPIRRDVEDAGRLSGLNFIVNTILDENGEIAGVVCGHPFLAFTAGVDRFCRLYTTPIDRPFSFVITGSGPCDSEFYQANKALSSVGPAVHDGGHVLLVSPCKKGISAFSYFNDMVTSGKSFSHWKEYLSKPEAPRKTAAEICLSLRHLLDVRKLNIGLVTPGIPPDTVAAMGMTPYTSVEEALNDILPRLNPSPRVGVIPKGPMALFRCEKTGG